MGVIRSYLGVERVVGEWVGLEKKWRIEGYGILTLGCGILSAPLERRVVWGCHCLGKGGVSRSWVMEGGIYVAKKSSELASTHIQLSIGSQSINTGP